MSAARSKTTKQRRTVAPRPFSVPAGVKHLPPTRLEALTRSFRKWYQQSKGPKERRARGRVWLTFLIIRYTGAKLGETVAIDELKDLDLGRGVLTLGGTGRNPTRRDVRLPPDVVEELRAYLREPENKPLRGKVFGLDQGFVRRKFYERAESCSIPRDLASPQVVRVSRALELLNGGVPLPVVQQILGQQTANLTASYIDYEPNDVGRIFESFLLSEMRTRVSARNLFPGLVARIARGKILSEIELETAEGHRVVSVITNTSLKNLGLRKGAPVIAQIKAPLVTVHKGKAPPETSACNVFSGRVTAVRSDGVAAEVIALLDGDVEVCSLITAGSVDRMHLEVDDKAWMVFDSSAVVLSIAGHGTGTQRAIS